jgi:hypothetical protein
MGKRHLTLITSLILIYQLCYSQTISTSVLNVSLKSGYSFSDNKDMDVSLVKKYEYGSQDTTYFINIQIKNSDTEKTGGSIGWSYGLGLGASSNYSIKKEYGFINIYKESYSKIQKCLSSGYFFIKNNVDKSKTKINATCGDDVLTFVSEYEPNKNPKFYLRLDDAVYPMLDEDFSKVMILFSTAKKYFKIND